MATASGSSKGSPEERRIWIGNLDPRLSEYQLLKIVQKCGPIEKFDMLFHKSGPLVGQSRGYAFVTFLTTDGARIALRKLNGTPVVNRPIAVRLAKNVNYDELEKPKPRIEIPALGTTKREGKISTEEAIRAIEAKLKFLEKNTDLEMEINTIAGSTNGVPPVPFIQRYQFNKDRDANNSHQRSGRLHTKSNSGPYNRNHRPRRR
ncbi:probable RNA-binding protein 18 [Teleopsis dalmanni]|uniref:probable RNA-binding protein 18 n=1 Tax=Teleopsis dalmanni TaxID=139649 RepID=UPI0018CF01B4|nr:probable RNA-binding protein 18 [Teleopsis dalmanni]